jgi:hypothetical protein
MLQTDEISKNSVSLAGEFAVLTQLTLRGFDANLTLGHTKGVDILVSDPKIGNMFRIEVKTSYANKPAQVRLFGYVLSWIMSEKHENLVDPKLFYCFVNIEKQTNLFRFFIVPSAIVASYVKEEHQWWQQHRKEHERKAINTVRQFRIGLDDDGNKYSIPTPLAKDYENKWAFT